MACPLNGRKPSSTLCRKAGCMDLVAKNIETGSGYKHSYYCGINDRIPGNMSKCPKEAE